MTEALLRAGRVGGQSQETLKCYIKEDIASLGKVL